MSLHQFQQELAKGLPSPVYLFHSSEAFLLYEAFSAIRELFQGGDACNFNAYDMKSPDEDVPVEQIVDVLNTLPFLSKRKTVVIKNVQKLSKAETKKAEAYLANPSPSTLLVMLHEGAAPKLFDSSVLKGIKMIAVAVQEKEIPLWIRMNAKKKGITLTDKAIEYLISFAGTDLGMLYSEIEKLSCCDASKAIDVDDIRGTVYSGADYNAFDLVDALKRGDAREVFGIFESVMRNQDPQMLLGALNYQYARQNASYGAMQRRPGAGGVFRLLHEADAAVKTSHKYVIEGLLVKLLRKA